MLNDLASVKCLGCDDLYKQNNTFVLQYIILYPPNMATCHVYACLELKQFKHLW